MPKLLLTIATLFVAAAVQAQVYVAGPRGCELVAGLSDGAVLHALDEDHLIFDGAGLEGIEWHCAFEPPFDTAAQTGEIQIRTGYCEEPGPIIYPQVFTLLNRGDGTAQLDATTWGEALLLDICDGP